MAVFPTIALLEIAAARGACSGAALHRHGVERELQRSCRYVGGAKPPTGGGGIIDRLQATHLVCSFFRCRLELDD
jgi:hypothetical protein